MPGLHRERATAGTTPPQGSQTHSIVATTVTKRAEQQRLQVQALAGGICGDEDLAMRIVCELLPHPAAVLATRATVDREHRVVASDLVADLIDQVLEAGYAELAKDQAEGLGEQRARRARYVERVDQAYSA